MLGRFLEYSVVTPDIAASLEFYCAIGFSTVAVGEAWPHPYAAVTDGRIHIGMHQEPSFERSLTFVKPELLKHLDGLEKLGVAVEFRRLAGDVFNEIGWFDLSGHLIRLIEARTFSPLDRATKAASLCGYFSEVALPVQSVEDAKNYWERFGFVGLEDPLASSPHVSCTSDTIDIGLYATSFLQEPSLIFEVDNVEQAVSQLKAAGIPARRQRSISAAVKAPEGTALLLVAAADD